MCKEHPQKSPSSEYFYVTGIPGNEPEITELGHIFSSREKKVQDTIKTDISLLPLLDVMGRHKAA
jgi:hypothetical protein